MLLKFDFFVVVVVVLVLRLQTVAFCCVLVYVTDFYLYFCEIIFL